MDNQTGAYRRLIEISRALSAEKDLGSLLHHILDEAKTMAHADAGTIYLNEDDESLAFSIVLNDTLGVDSDRWQDDALELPRIPFRDEDGAKNLSNVSSFAAHKGQTVLVDDARKDDRFDFSGFKDFDKLFGYESVSFLAVPLRTIDEECVGVLQLLNAKDDNGDVVPFPDETIPLIEALASQACIAIKNRELIDELEELKGQLEEEVDTRTEQLKDALSKLSEAHIVMQEMNTIDAVTNVRTRQYFDEVLDQEWRRAKRQGYEVSLLLLDIDYFKKVNDTYGHLAGDSCLAAVGSLVDSLFNRPSDVVARYGGEEFAVVLPYVTAENALSVAEQVREKVEECEIDAEGHTINITMSVGAATLGPTEDDTDPRDLIGWADQALYEAKAAGRNRVVQWQKS